MTVHATTPQTSFIEFKNVTLRYDHMEIFNNVSFNLAQGSMCYLTGESGAGKSSLLRLIYQGNDQYSGDIKLFGNNLKAISKTDRPRYRQQVGVVFQDFNLLEHLSAVDNVSLPLRIMGMDPRECEIRARKILDWVGLGAHFDALPKTLSGGQQQRVVIARAVIANPKILLADEPTGNVDDRTAVKLMELFEGLNRLGTTVVIATHNRDLVAEFPHPELHLSNKNLEFFEPYQDVPEKVAVNAAPQPQASAGLKSPRVAGIRRV